MEHHTEGGMKGDPLLLAVRVQTTTVPTLDVAGQEWDDICDEEGGWEYIDGTVEQGEEKDRRNDLGERTGIARLKEALEANMWEASTGVVGEDEEGSEGELEVEEMGKALIQGDEGDEDVRALESMMLKLQAVRDAGSDLPEQERKKMAARAVKEVMSGL